MNSTELKRYFAGIIGNVLEYYDGALYGFLIPVLAPLFFPSSDPVFALICAFCLLPLGFLAQPLGAFAFGWLWNRIGREKTLSCTLIGMAAATVSIGCLPLYESAGWIAPLLLCGARFLQNFFSAGETTGGALFLLEQTEKKRRGWISSLFDASSVLGIILASFAAMMWGDYWRWLFWAGALAGLVGFSIRQSMTSGLRSQIKYKEIWREWRRIVSIAFVVGYSYGNYYISTHLFNSFLPMVSKVDLKTAIAMNTWMLCLDLLLLPVFGLLTLRIEKERLMKAALLMGLLFSLPFFLLLENAGIGMAMSVRIALMIIGVCFSAPYHAWAMEQCPPERRFIICALGFALGSRMIGAPIPAFSLWLYHQTNWVGSAALPILGVALAAGWILLKSRAVDATLHSAS